MKKIMRDQGETDNSQLIIYRTEDGKIKIDVRFKDETVWLSQKQMGDMFQVSIPTINEHIKTIYEDGELTSGATIRKFRIVQNEGIRQVSRLVDFYNLDMIISLGYRVKSHEIAIQHAEKQYEEFNLKRIKKQDELESDFDRSVKMIEEKTKTVK